MRMRLLMACCAMTMALAGSARAADWTVVAWNDLGMHCMDADYSVFSILPPYNTIHAQVIDANGDLITDPGGLQVSYQAIQDPAGSINRSSVGKTDFWDWVFALYGAGPAVDEGLAGYAMPGTTNTPQVMAWDSGNGWFTAEGIPITPYDDQLRPNAYPMMRVSVRNTASATLATVDIVLPVSDEMDCSACHASGSAAAARPLAGWVNDPDPQIDYRRNILRLHDDHRATGSLFQAAAAAVGYEAQGLEATVATAPPTRSSPAPTPTTTSPPSRSKATRAPSPSATPATVRNRRPSPAGRTASTPSARGGPSTTILTSRRARRRL